MEVDLGGPGQQRVAISHGADEPLSARDDFERTVALLEELDRMGDRSRLGQQFAGRLQLADDDLLGLLGAFANDLGVGAVDGHGIGRSGEDAAVAADDGSGGQLEFAPPDHVGEVTERADHGDARTLFRVGEFVGEHRHFDAVERRADGGAEQRLVAGVVGMGHERHTRSEQLGTRGFDHDVAIAIGAVERDRVIGARHLLVDEFGLGHRGTEVDVPQRGRFDLVGHAGFEVAKEGALRHPLRLGADGRVDQVPVDRQAEAAEQGLEHLLVFGGERVAELDEVLAADRCAIAEVLGHVAVERWREVRVVRLRRITGHAVEVLDAALRGQTVVVPAHWVEHALAPHALVAGDGVGVGVAEHVAHVKRPAHRGGRGVDGVHVGPFGGAIEGVDAVGVPYAAKALLKSVEGGLVGNAAGHKGFKVTGRTLLPRAEITRSGHRRGRDEKRSGLGWGGT